jgi:hypothetical protein
MLAPISFLFQLDLLETLANEVLFDFRFKVKLKKRKGYAEDKDRLKTKKKGDDSLVFSLFFLKSFGCRAFDFVSQIENSFCWTSQSGWIGAAS